jgi:hypothetical protein
MNDMDHITSPATPSCEEVFDTPEFQAEYELWLNERQQEFDDNEDAWDATFGYAASIGIN